MGFEQNPAEIWLANVPQLYQDKVFMKHRKEQEKLYIAQRTAELGCKSSDTFVTLRRGGKVKADILGEGDKGRGTPASKMTSSKTSSRSQGKKKGGNIKKNAKKS